ncbi:MAG: hypothetical protein ACXVFN_21645 [Solirubrobacteraceae bacterium]
MTNEERDDRTKASGTASGEELRRAGTRTSPPGTSNTDEQAKQTSEERLEQAGGGH